MALFSQRHGLRPLSKAIQKEQIDEDLKNSLWTALHAEVFGRIWGLSQYDPRIMELNALLQGYWTDYFKLPLDKLPSYGDAVDRIRKDFFTWRWDQILDFIEFTAKNTGHFRNHFKNRCNQFLQRENSAYRFVGDEITPITDDIEINTIESSLSSGIAAVAEHLGQSLALLSDRKNPDFRNSIKESISAVEAVCRLLSGATKATLGAALKRISEKSPFHPAFEKGLLALYGFTNDEQGIRHSLLEESSISYADAKFMLVLSSGFCNFLVAKCAENDIRL